MYSKIWNGYYCFPELYWHYGQFDAYVCQTQCVKENLSTVKLPVRDPQGSPPRPAPGKSLT